MHVWKLLINLVINLVVALKLSSRAILQLRAINDEQICPDPSRTVKIKMVHSTSTDYAGEGCDTRRSHYARRGPLPPSIFARTISAQQQQQQLVGSHRTRLNLAK